MGRAVRLGELGHRISERNKRSAAWVNSECCGRHRVHHQMLQWGCCSAALLLLSYACPSHPPPSPPPHHTCMACRARPCASSSAAYSR